MRRVVVSAGSALIFALIACSGNAGSSNPPATPPPPRRDFAVLTYNLNAPAGPSEATLKVIDESGADLVVMQEAHHEIYDFLRERLKAKYPHGLLVKGENEWCNLAVLSKAEVTLVEQIAKPADGWFPALLLTAKTPAGTVQVLDVHLRPRIVEDSAILGHLTVGPLHRREIDDLLQHAKPGVPTLVIGDFNEEAGAPALARLEQLGFTSAIPADDHTPTFHGKRYGLVIQARIDHVLYSHDFTCLDAHVVPGGGSDHQPVYARLEWRGSK